MGEFWGDLPGRIVRAPTGGAMVALLLLTGVILTVRFRFYPLRGARSILRHTLGTLFQKEQAGRRGISPFQAVTTALAGTMGVGNIAGVATALVAGGPGAVVWMWIGAFFGMTTKYAEIFLAVRYRKQDRSGNFYGGPMYYIRDGMGSRPLAACFALLCALCSFGIGNLAQIHSVASAMEASFGASPPVVGVGFALLLALVIFGGVRRIARVTEWVIPFFSIFYLCFAGVFLFLQRAQLPSALSAMVADAAGIAPAAGGLLGCGVSRAARMGLARGVFTNEAGLGSAPIAHAAADCQNPSLQAVWGIFEVFLDTVLVCTVTALVILSAEGGALWRSGLDGAPLTSRAFESLFPGIGAGFVAVSIAFFAFASMLGWCYYGEQALRYLSGGSDRVTALYRLAFLACAVVGATGRLEVVWGISDLLNALMAAPNAMALIALRGQVRMPAEGGARCGTSPGG